MQQHFMFIPAGNGKPSRTISSAHRLIPSVLPSTSDSSTTPVYGPNPDRSTPALASPNEKRTIRSTKPCVTRKKANRAQRWIGSQAPQSISVMHACIHAFIWDNMEAQ